MTELKLRTYFDIKDIPITVAPIFIGVVISGEPHILNIQEEGRIPTLIRARSCGVHKGTDNKYKPQYGEVSYSYEHFEKVFVFNTHAELFQWVADELKKFLTLNK